MRRGGPVHISTVIDEIMGPGDLPLKVMAAKSGSGVLVGDIFEWDPVRRAYVNPDIEVVAPAMFVRACWGTVFCSVPVRELEPVS